MEKIVFPVQDLSKVLGKNKANIKQLERMLDVKLEISSNDVAEITVKSSKKREFDEYIAVNAIEALTFGFDIDAALQLRNTDYLFRKIDIKAMVKGSRVSITRGRIIGKQGKIIKLLEKVSECDITIKDHVVGIIGKAENVDLTGQSILALIRGAPQSKAISRLEKDMAKLRATEKPIEEMIG